MAEVTDIGELAAIRGGRTPADDGWQVLVDGGRLLADYLTRALKELPDDDPWRDEIAAAASGLRAAAGSREDPKP